jgi:hypothetical protein
MAKLGRGTSMVAAQWQTMDGESCESNLASPFIADGLWRRVQGFLGADKLARAAVG